MNSFGSGRQHIPVPRQRRRQFAVLVALIGCAALVVLALRISNVRWQQVGAFEYGATAVQTPARTPQGLLAADQAYLDSLRPTIVDATSGLQALSDQAVLASQAPANINNPQWQLFAGTALASVHASGLRLAAQRTVPSDLVAYDVLLVTAGNEMVAASSLFTSGMEKSSMSEFESSVEHVQAAQVLIAQSTRELQAISAQHGAAK